MLIEIDRFSRTPIYEQVINQIEDHIATGILKSGDLLPSVRALSQSTSVNPNTLQKAYAELERRGLCYSVPGSGRSISENARSLVIESKKNSLQALKELTSELCLAGVELEEILDAVRNIYNSLEKGNAK